MYFLYKYVKRKRQERKGAVHPLQTAAQAEQRDEGQPVTTSNDSNGTTSSTLPKSSTRTQIIKTIILMIGLALPVFLETLDYTIVATAQAHIASIFNSLPLQSYIGTVYLLTSTVFLPLFATFADIFGRHWTLQLALLLFMVGSAISTGSNNMPTLLAGRGIAGIGAAGLLAAVRIILADSVSLDANNWQQSAMFFLYTIGFCLGPFIGGALFNVSFRWVFAINLPCAAAAMVIAFVLLRGRTKSAVIRELPDSSNVGHKESFGRRLFRVDWIGAIMFMGAGILVLLALNWGSSERWSETKVIVSWVIGGVLAIGFVIWEVVLEHIGETSDNSSRLFVDPMIPMSLFRSLDVCVVMYATFVTGVIMLVMFYFVAIFSTIVNGLSPDKAGAQLIYFAPGMGGGSIISIYAIKIWRQPKYPAILGGIVETVALGLISLGMEHNNQSQVDGFMAMAGVGVGLSLGPLAVHARFSQPEALVAVVSALSLFFRSFGGTVGLAQCGAVLNAKVNTFIAGAIASGAFSNSDISSLTAATASSSLTSLQDISGLPPNVQQLVKDAFRNALKWCFISLIPWSALAAVLTVTLSPIQDRAYLAQQKPVDSDGGYPLESAPQLQNNTPKTDVHQSVREFNDKEPRPYA
ncbi:hypothetical protein EUX98_g3402 [Antrodiella citrinella]|uniref:Major facilitator superfamily (MFS) profile domain-containing protein n=1 Tax=Antrodiella citrinella TaxID=2447956 RepID=A0A4S4MWL9_9APHY|nr:hypothetical protein EUX98_g3402 [Antrodiella citrinella]